MQVIEAILSMLASVANWGVLIGLGLGLLTSFVVWHFMPVGDMRGGTAAVAFVAVFVASVLVSQLLKSRR